MDFVWKLCGNTYAVHVTVALVGVATLNLFLPAPPVCVQWADPLETNTILRVPAWPKYLTGVYAYGVKWTAIIA